MLLISMTKSTLNTHVILCVECIVDSLSNWKKKQNKTETDYDVNNIIKFLCRYIFCVFPLYSEYWDRMVRNICEYR